MESLEQFENARSGECPKEFVVGRFYRVQPSSWSRKKIPALCVFKGKRQVKFEYLCKYEDGKTVKSVATRSLFVVEDGNEQAVATERFSTISTTYAHCDVADKPKGWDDIPTTYNVKAKRKG